MAELFGFREGTFSLISPKVGFCPPFYREPIPDTNSYVLKSLNGQIFDFEGEKVGEGFSIPLENMKWDEKFLSDYPVFNALDLYIPS